MNKLVAVFVLSVLINNALSISTIKEALQKPQKEDYICDACLQSLKALQRIQDIKKIYDLGIEVNISVCKLLLPEIGLQQKLCKEFIDVYAPVVWDGLINKVINPTKVCQKMGYCHDVFQYATIEEFKKQLFSTQNKYQQNKDKQVNNNENSNYTFLHLTDSHFDRYYLEDTDMNCDGPSCCRLVTNSTHSGYQSSGYWGSQGNCDLPERTYDQLFQNIKEQQPNLDFILWTGDSMDHFEQLQEQSTQTSNMKTIYDLLEKHFEGVKILGIYGNHECYPESQCDVEGKESQWLLDDTSAMLEQQLDLPSYQLLKSKGYYAYTIKEKNLKVIMLNTQTCDLTNFYLITNPSDPSQQLQWLQQELLKSEQVGQVVYIAGHIPPTHLWCGHDWSQRYNLIVQRYQNTIQGQFYGHTHQDHLTVQKADTINRIQDKPVTAVLFITPSITTFTYQLPSYRVFQADSSSHQILDYYQYRLNRLQEFNLLGSKAVLQFDLQYQFTKEYGLDNLSLKALNSRFNNIMQSHNQQYLLKYLNNYYPGQQDFNPESLKDKSKYISIVCATQYSDRNDQIQCQGTDFLSQSQNYLFVFLNKLIGKWYENPQNE